MDKQTTQKILDAVDDKRVIEFEQSIVRIPSFTTEETPLASHIVNYFQGLGGLEVELQEVSLDDRKTSHNAVARLRGTGGGPTLLIFGHMDHGPILGRDYASHELEGWTHKPFGAEIEGDWLYGKGCQDEKGGITGFVMAAEVLIKSGVKLKGDVIFAGVQGHKRVSSGTLHLLKQDYKIDYAINTENSGNMIVQAFVGRSEGKIHIKAKELHFHIKDIFPQFKVQLTAFEIMNQILAALGPEMQSPGPDTWMTFTKHSDLPNYPQIRMEIVEFHHLGYLVLEFQIRTVPGMTDETITQDLRRMLDKFEDKYPYLDTRVEWPSRTKTRPAASTSRDHPLVQSLAHWHERVTGEPGDVGSQGRSGAAADGSHTHEAGITTVLYGPGGGEKDKEYRLKAHLKEGQPDERIAIKDLITTTKVLALTAADICG
jgi:acetylornithine deacetylase